LERDQVPVGVVDLVFLTSFSACLVGSAAASAGADRTPTDRVPAVRTAAAAVATRRGREGLMVPLGVEGLARLDVVGFVTLLT
jgi:hypothetical protein